MVEWKQLGDCIISLKTGLNPRKNFVLNSEGSTNYYITVRELDYWKINPSDKTDKVDDNAIKIINNRSNLEEGDVLFSGTGTIGRTALVNETPKNWNIKEGVYTIKPKKDVLNSKFLIELFHSYYLINKINEYTVGDPIRSVPMKNLVQIQIPIPDIIEQERIVDILDTFTSSIDNLKQQIAQRRKQYEYYRDQLLDLEGKEGVEMKTLGEVCDIKGDYGLSVPSKPFDGVRYLRITDITDMGGLNDDLVSADLKEESNKEPLVDGDILFARTGATVGKTLVYRNELGRCLFAGYLIRYRLNKSMVSPQFMFHFTHSTRYYNWVQSSLAIGAQPNISAQRYNVLNIPVPSLSKQQRIVDILDQFEASIQNLESQLSQREKQYEYYRNKLLTFEE